MIFAVSTARDRGILKRVAGTPLPVPVFIAAWSASSIITAFSSVFFLIIVGMIFFGVSIDPGTGSIRAMTAVIRNTSQLTPEDRNAMAHSIESLPAVEGPKKPAKK